MYFEAVGKVPARDLVLVQTHNVLIQLPATNTIEFIWQIDHRCSISHRYKKLTIYAQQYKLFKKSHRST
jgi:hypothetical protein